ncbi:CheC, inhibitor of MCP methylation [Desulfitobacterium dehalogenans ATCC 51507]|uniref:CheC, inhibitor of MCP methylation n=1 Tax=Desulfitobacterium dehalogenans (strain ATCC 51507 / DSM 9161 / JW/IU-DC1) TaxID=756499 RepID=I4ACW4_DESDJ|nr:flagellar motor switch phosphatase FliY [Desulfitobacterium dehalogenans]AFM01799.1 CheC, inhibitor of MCP methylation [Desulfitobacterium dehalogenans ATCC 51507]
MGNGMLSQEEIDALLGGNLETDPPAENEPKVEFSDMEKDAIGEIANISMGTAATTLSQLLGKKVEITTPKVDMASAEQIRKDYPIPSVIVDVRYKAGIEGSNLLILSQRDGAVIVDLMMGGTGENPPSELSELGISGIAEAMNQMMGSAATSMSTMFNSVVDITPPQLVLNDMSPKDDDIITNVLQSHEELVRISFRMVVEDVIDSILVQVIPIHVAKGMVNKLLGTMGGTGSKPEAKPTPPPRVEQPQAPNTGYAQPTAPIPGPSMPSPQGAYGNQPPQVPYIPQPQPEYPQQQQGYGGPAYGQNQGGYYASGYGAPPTSVQPAQFVPLRPADPIHGQENLELILDVPLQVSVELGKAKKTIKEILELGPGSVIELDRLAGEPVDMIVNGKLVAKCEVVVINETFGIRITDIIQPSERMTKAIGL